MRAKVLRYSVNLRAGRSRYWVYRIAKQRFLRVLLYPLYGVFLKLCQWAGLISHLEDWLSGRPQVLPLRSKSLLQRDLVRPSTAEHKPKILLVRPDHLGDLLYSLPSLLLIIDEFKDSHEIAILVDPCNADLAHQLNLFDEIHVFPLFNSEGKRCLPSMAEYKKLVACLGPLDYLIDLKPDKGSYFLIDWLAAKHAYRIVSNVPQIREFLGEQAEPAWRRDAKNDDVWWYFSHQVTAHRPRFIFEFAQAVLQSRRPSLPVLFDAYVQKAQELLQRTFPRTSFATGATDLKLALCLESRDPDKAWDGRERDCLLQSLDERGLVFDLIGQRKTWSQGAQLANHDYRGSMTLPEVLHYLSQMDCYVGFDSGLAHFCALRGIQTICIYTAKTSPIMWSPISVCNNLTILAPKQSTIERDLLSGREKVRFQDAVSVDAVISHIISICHKPSYPQLP